MSPELEEIVGWSYIDALITYLQSLILKSATAFAFSIPPAAEGNCC